MQLQLSSSADELDTLIGKLVIQYRFVSFKNIEHFTNKFCEKFNITEIPRDPFHLLPDVFGIKLERNGQLPGSEPARWMRLNGQYSIHLSNYRDSNQISLSLWHEFAEIIFSHKRFPTRLTPEMECRLATLFAVYMTMPTETIMAMAQELGHPDRDDKTAVLANRCGVSLTAMRHRLIQLGIPYNRYK